MRTNIWAHARADADGTTSALLLPNICFAYLIFARAISAFRANAASRSLPHTTARLSPPVGLCCILPAWDSGRVRAGRACYRCGAYAGLPVCIALLNVTGVSRVDYRACCHLPLCPHITTSARHPLPQFRRFYNNAPICASLDMADNMVPCSRLLPRFCVARARIYHSPAPAGPL